VVSFFIFQNNCLAEPVLKIFDIQYEGEKADEDFIKIKNNTDQEINLDNYRLAKQTSSGRKEDIKSFSKNDTVAAEESYLWASNKIKSYPDSIKADTSTSKTISKDNGIAIIYGSLDDGEIIDSENWKDDEEKEEDEEQEMDYSNIKINEIYPAPNTKNEEEEFVEIKNNSKNDTDFSDWVIRDSKGKKGKISDVKEKGNFLVFYGSFSLNNDSEGDEVFLYDKNDNLIDSQKYSKGKSAYSYSFDGSDWRWTSFSTPGEENIFDKILSGKIIKDDKIYADIYAYFEVKADKDAKKFTWNFGDGHKSYLKSTKHKYEKAGKYSASLKITGQGEDKIYEFEVKVEKYKAPKVKIISLSPNPVGSDTDNEWIEIKNESKKKVNLKDWSIATGWEKFINHPIREDFEIKAGKTKKLMRDICAFTLVNTKDKIELRSPNGKAVQKIEYNHGEKSIAEGEIYSEIDGDWKWINTQPLKTITQTKTKVVPANIAYQPIEIKKDDLGKYTLDPNWKNKKQKLLKLVYSGYEISLPEKFFNQELTVLGAKTVRTQNNHYVFTTPKNRKHWAITFFNSFWLKLNSSINKLI